MNRRESTNVKLAAIINSKNNDQEEEEAVLNEELKAKVRLRRSSLYGGGARTKVPKIKKLAKSDKSPFELSGAPVVPAGPKPFDHSIPPGAHSYQYRVVANNTMKSYKDPDRVCINSSSMLEGLQVLSQPPWYCGNDNKIKPADTNPFTAAARYGFRGSKNIQQYCTDPREVPSKTRTEYTPKFLSISDNYINEWVPPIIAATYSTINGLETPKLWPENAEYVTGYRNKKLPKSSSYKRETTVDASDPPQSSQSLRNLMGKTQEHDGLLHQYARQESAKTHLSMPMTAQATFQDSWKQTLDKHAGASLLCNMKCQKPVYEPHALMDPSDTIKYSGTTAMIVHTQSTDELKFRLRMERSKSKSKTPFHLKWQHVIIHYNNISKKLKRGQTMKKVIREIAQSLRSTAVVNGSETSLRRIDFIKACSYITYFDGVTSKQLSLLYSLFDPMRRNAMRYVEFIGLLSVLDRAHQLPARKLQSLWRLHCQYGLDRNIFDIVLEILSCCAYSVPDFDIIEQLFKAEFRSNCYKLAISGTKELYGDITSSSPSRPGTSSYSAPSTALSTHRTATTSSTNNNNNNNNNSSNSHNPVSSSSGAVPTKLCIQQQNDSDDSCDEEIDNCADNRNASTSAAMLQQKRSLSVQPQYNICEHYLDEHSLIKVLQLCPTLLAEFDRQLSARLIQCHGSDDRYAVPEDESADKEENMEDKDFTWILKKAAPEREVFGLY